MPKTVLPAHQARSRKSLELLLKAAADVLNKDGLEGATIPKIAARAGLSPGSVYRRFPDKDALLREVCLRLFEENYQQSKELLKPERLKGASLEQISRQIIILTLRGHRLTRGLLRAIFFFTMQHPDAAFVRKIEELEWKVFELISQLLLTRRKEIHHPDPESAVRFAILMVGIAAQGLLVLPPRPDDFSRFLPDIDAQIERELPRMFLRYLGVEE
jgi:AcrR family transcriptional regulator